MISPVELKGRLLAQRVDLVPVGANVSVLQGDMIGSIRGGDMRSTIRALIVANDYLESEVGELMKAVSHAFVRGRFHTYSG